MTGSSSSTSSGVLPLNSGYISIKLDRTNYHLWLAQIAPLLNSKSLMGFVDGSNKCPAIFKSDATGKETKESNPDYLVWYEQDQLILSWINNSLTPSVLSTVARSRSSCATWKSLEKRYASQSKNRILQLKTDLHNTVRDNLSISDFVDKINGIADNLALAGSPVDDDELVTIIMKNVGATYEVTVSSAQARDNPISLEDLVALLLSAEQRYLSQNSQAQIVPTAMYAPRNNSRGRSTTNRGSISRGRGAQNNFRGTNSSSKETRDSYKEGPTMSTRPVCQICGRVCQICGRANHTAIDCYNRMNLAYEGRVPTKQLSAMAASPSFFQSGSTWYSDTGASNHITSELGNLAMHDEYRGKDKVAVGNGSGPKDREDPFSGEE